MRENFFRLTFLTNVSPCVPYARAAALFVVIAAIIFAAFRALREAVCRTINTPAHLARFVRGKMGTDPL